MPNRLNESMCETKSYTNVGWNYRDIQVMKPHWSRERCNEFLRKIEGDLEEAMVREGWGFIEWELRNEAD